MLGRAKLASACLAGLALAAPASAPAQEAGPPPDLGVPVPAVPNGSPILTLDQDRMFAESAFGKRVQAEIDAASHALAAENRQIEAQLSEEEKSLTEKRATMAADAFRKLADEFDTRVEGIRRDQGAKARDIARLRDRERQRFFRAAVPVLGQIVRDAGAVAILNAQAIVLSFDSIDITDEAIRRIDTTLGDGGPAPDPGTDGNDTGNAGGGAGTLPDGTVPAPGIELSPPAPDPATTPPAAGGN